MEKKQEKPTMLSFVKDLPNICSLTGLFSAILAIYFVIPGHFNYALIAILWAVLFDWMDGIIARKMKNRSQSRKEFGPQLDSLIDMVSFGIFPAVFLLSYGDYSLWFLPGAFFIVAAAAIRLSYFNIFGMIDGQTYKGLALDNNVIILAFLFLFEGFFTHTVFSIFLYLILMGFLGLNLAPIKTPKFTGNWIYVLAANTVLMSIILW